MRFLVFGAGAQGSLFGGLLAAKHDVVLVGRRAHVEAIRSAALIITGKTEKKMRLAAAETVDGLDAPDAVVITVKSYDTESALEALRPFWKQSVFLSLQNGLGNESVLASRAAKVLGGVTMQGVTFRGPGEIYHAGVGETRIGCFAGASSQEASTIVAAFQQAGIPCRLSENIEREIWQKAALNAAVNPVTALLGVKTGYVAKLEPVREIVESVVRESVAVASAEGVSLEEDELLQMIWKVAVATAQNRSSMLQDLEKGRRTEIDAINGAIAERGEARGMACPLNRLLTRMVRAAELAARRR